MGRSEEQFSHNFIPTVVVVVLTIMVAAVALTSRVESQNIISEPDPHSSQANSQKPEAYGFAA